MSRVGLRVLLPIFLIAVAFLLSGSDVSPEHMQPGVATPNGILVLTNQLLNPAGNRIPFAGRPVDLALSPDANIVAVLLSGSLRLYTPSGQLIRSVSTDPSAGGIAFLPGGDRILISQMKTNGAHGIALVDPRGAAATAWMALRPGSGPAGIVVDPAGRFAYVALNLANALARIDLATGDISTVAVGLAPLGVAITPDGARIFVTNQAGTRPRSGDVTAMSAGTPILIDHNGAARSGTISVIDTAAFVIVAELPAGLLPGAVQISPDGAYAAVANANSDSITLIPTATLHPVSTISVPAQPGGFGSSPTALAFEHQSNRLYVACGGNNSIAVLAPATAASGSGSLGVQRRPSRLYTLAGNFPTDWYPIAVATGPNRTVFIANSKGIGTHSGGPPYKVTSWLGTMTIVPREIVDAAPATALSRNNDPFRDADVPGGSPADLRSLGINHVFLIIKENRTYDQVLGDIGKGNGDPSLTLYGRTITPNHHALASQFVLLDNFYAAGTVSPDGHQWLTQSYVTPYLERAFPAFARGYPYMGEDALAFAPTGFLWTNAQAHGLSARVFGEYTTAPHAYPLTWSDYLQDAEGPMQTTLQSYSLIAALDTLVEHNYPSFALNVPDTYRVRKFLDRFSESAANHTLPNLTIVQLPADHTVGVAPGLPSPNSMVADNDLAIGQLVEAISNSSYWPRSAIFITEDDAQDGVDHVDGHRTLCLVISPYVRRRVVDSTNYNQTSIVRTIEDLLGLPPMNKFDAAALPMRSAFTTDPDFSTYFASPNLVPLGQLNPNASLLSGPQRQAALASSQMNFSVPDAAPEGALNRILWQAAKGWNVKYPRIPHRANCEVDDDDDARPRSIPPGQ